MYSRGGGSDAHRQGYDREPFDRGDSSNGSGRGGRGQGSYLSNRSQDQVRRGQRQNGGDGYGRRSRSPPPPNNRNRPPSSSVRGLSHSPVRDRSVAHHSSKLDYYGPPLRSENERRQDAYLQYRRSYSHYGSQALGSTRCSSDASNWHRKSPQRCNGQVGLPSSSIVPVSSSSRGRSKQQQEQVQQQQKSSITPPPGASGRNNADGDGSGRPAPSSRGIDGQLLGFPFASVGPVIPGPLLHVDLPPQLQVPQNIMRLVNWRDPNLLELILKCDRRGLANDALFYLGQLHRMEGYRTVPSTAVLSKFARYGIEFPRDFILPWDPQNLLGCPGIRNYILSARLPKYQLNSCLRDIIDFCGKKNTAASRMRKLSVILKDYREYRDSPLDPTVKEKLVKILTVTGVSKEYRFEIKLKQLEQGAALDALDSIDLGRGNSTGLLLVILNGALKSARGKGKIQAPLPPSESNTMNPSSSTQDKDFVSENETVLDNKQMKWSSPRIETFTDSTNVRVAGEHQLITAQGPAKSPAPPASASDKTPAPTSTSGGPKIDDAFETSKSTLEYLVRMKLDGDNNTESYRTELERLLSYDAGIIVSAWMSIVNSCGNSTDRFDSVLSVSFSFLYAAKKDKSEGKNHSRLHIAEFRNNEEVRKVLNGVCASNPISLVPLVQRWADRLVEKEVFSENFVNRTFKPDFTKMMQEAKKIESEREIKRLRIEEEERRRKENEKRQRREDERRHNFEETRRQLEAETRRSEEELAAVQASREKKIAERDVESMPSQLQSLEGVTESHLVEKLPPVVSRLQELTAANYIDSTVIESRDLIPMLQRLYRQLSNPSDLRDQAKQLCRRWGVICQTSRSADDGIGMDVDQDDRKRSANESPTKKPSGPNNGNVSRMAKKPRHISDDGKPMTSYEAAFHEQVDSLCDENGNARSKAAGLGDIAPVGPADEEQNWLEIPPEYYEGMPTEKVERIKAIIKYIVQHNDFQKNIARGQSIFHRIRLFLVLKLLDDDVISNLKKLIDENFSSMTPEEKLEMAQAKCQWMVDSDAKSFQDANGNHITDKEAKALLKRPGVYYVFGIHEDGNVKVIISTGGKFMSKTRVGDYVKIKERMIKRLCDANGNPPTKVIFCCMAQLPFLSYPKDDEVPDLRNRIVEVGETVALMILYVTIHGHGMYGDVRSMSHEEWRLNGKKSGMHHYIPGTTKGKSGVGKGGRGRPRKPSGDGSSCAYLDPMESWRIAQFEVCIELPKDSGEFCRYVGPLRWGGNGNVILQTTLYDDDAREYSGDSERTTESAYVSVEVDEDVLYLPPGGGDPMNLGTVESGDFEQYFQKPTPWVSIRGITLESNEADLLKDALHEKLDEVNIVECRRKKNGNFYVKFGLVQEAEGCEKMLDGQELLGGRVGVKRVYKEKE